MSARPQFCPSCSQTAVYVSLEPVSLREYQVNWACTACEESWSDVSGLGPLASIKGSCLACGAGLDGKDICAVCGWHEAASPEMFGWDGLELMKPVGNAKVAFSRGLFKKGMGLLNMALRQDFGQVDAWEMKFDFMRRLGMANEGVRMLEEAMEQGAPQDLIRLTGDWYQEQGQLEKAAEALTAYLSAFEVLTADQAEVLSNLGNIFQEMGESEKAEEAHAAALELDPLNVRIAQNYVAFLMEAGRMEEASPICEQTMLIAPDNASRAELLVMQAFIYAGMDALELAQNTLSLAFSMGHSSENGFLLAGRLAVELGEMENALSAFEKVLELNPENEFARMAVSALQG